MTSTLDLRDHIPGDPDFYLHAAPRSGPGGTYAGAGEETAHRAEALRDRLAVLEQECRSLLAAAEEALPGGGPANLDELVEGLLRVEESLGRAFDRQVVLLADEVQDAVSQPAVETTPVAPAEELRDLLGRCLEALRDCRWEMMALRAERSQDADRAVIEDASALAAHLQQLRA